MPTNPTSLDAFRHRTAKAMHPDDAEALDQWRWERATAIVEERRPGHLPRTLEIATEYRRLVRTNAMPPEKVDALEEAVCAAMLSAPSVYNAEQFAAALRAELEARGMEVRERVVMTEDELSRACYGRSSGGISPLADFRAGFLAAGGKLEGE